MEITTEAIETLARWYAREAGVRNLSKLVDKVGVCVEGTAVRTEGAVYCVCVSNLGCVVPGAVIWAKNIGNAFARRGRLYC